MGNKTTNALILIQVRKQMFTANLFIKDFKNSNIEINLDALNVTRIQKI